MQTKKYNDIVNCVRKNYDYSLVKNIKISFICAIILGYVTHAFMLFNKLPNHDDFIHLPIKHINFIGLGRWFFLPNLPSGMYSVPIIIGTLAILYLALLSITLILLFKIKKTFSCIIITGFIVTFPTLSSFFSYMHGSDAFIFALMLASLAILFTYKYRYGFVIASILFAFLLAIHPMFFCFALALFHTLVIIDLFNKTLLLEIIKKITRFTLSCLFGYVLYLFILKLLLTLTNLKLSTYQGADSLGVLLIFQLLKTLPVYIYETYHGVIMFFTSYPWGTINRFHTALTYLNIIMLTLFFTLLTFIYFRKKIYKDKWRSVILFVTLISLPATLNCMVIFSQGKAAALLYAYPMILVYILIVKLSEICLDNINDKNLIFNIYQKWITISLSILIIWNYFIITNQAYFQLHYAYQQLYAFTVRLETRIENTMGYDPNIPIVLIGRGTENCLSSLEFNKVNRITGILNAKEFFTCYSYSFFMKYYTGFNGIYLSYDKIREIRDTAEVELMPLYPRTGSIKIVNNILVVKFGNSEIFTPYNSEYYSSNIVDLKRDKIIDSKNIAGILK